MIESFKIGNYVWAVPKYNYDKCQPVIGIIISIFEESKELYVYYKNSYFIANPLITKKATDEEVMLWKLEQ
jgi:hypothetical protein